MRGTPAHQISSVLRVEFVKRMAASNLAAARMRRATLAMPSFFSLRITPSTSGIIFQSSPRLACVNTVSLRSGRPFLRARTAGKAMQASPNQLGERTSRWNGCNRRTS